jgi:glucose/arabinose dehydrogenase
MRQTNSEVGRGLLGIEVDPQFEDNGHIYVAYVEDDTTDKFYRLSRLTVTDPSAVQLTIDPESELLLLQGDQPADYAHLGGVLRFGPDGKLFWAAGNNDYDPNNPHIGDNAQDLSNIYGKIP